MNPYFPQFSLTSHPKKGQNARSSVLVSTFYSELKVLPGVTGAKEESSHIMKICKDCTPTRSLEQHTLATDLFSIVTF